MLFLKPFPTLFNEYSLRESPVGILIEGTEAVDDINFTFINAAFTPNSEYPLKLRVVDVGVADILSSVVVEAIVFPAASHTANSAFAFSLFNGTPR